MSESAMLSHWNTPNTASGYQREKIDPIALLKVADDKAKEEERRFGPQVAQLPAQQQYQGAGATPMPHFVLLTPEEQVLEESNGGAKVHPLNPLTSNELMMPIMAPAGSNDVKTPGFGFGVGQSSAFIKRFG